MMTVNIDHWLKLHSGSRIEGRVVTSIQGQIGRAETGEFVCGVHYRPLRRGQAGNWTCPITGCDTRIETQPAN